MRKSSGRMDEHNERETSTLEQADDPYYAFTTRTRVGNDFRRDFNVHIFGSHDALNILYVLNIFNSFTLLSPTTIYVTTSISRILLVAVPNFLYSYPEIYQSARLMPNLANRIQNLASQRPSVQEPTLQHLHSKTPFYLASSQSQTSTFGTTDTPSCFLSASYSFLISSMQMFLPFWVPKKSFPQRYHPWLSVTGSSTK